MFLHNNPSPPTGDTISQDILPLTLTAPSAATLYNYDVDRNPWAGLTIVDGGIGPTETDTTRFQSWRTPALPSSLTVSGTVRVVLWSGSLEFNPGKPGRVTVFLRHFDGSGYTEIAQGSLFEPDWQGGSDTWVEKTIDITDVNYTIPPGGQLEVKVIVGAAAQTKMWFAYDTITYDSRVEMLSSAGASTLTRMTTASGAPTLATTTRARPSPITTENPRFCIWYPWLCDWLCKQFSWLCD